MSNDPSNEKEKAPIKVPTNGLMGTEDCETIKKFPYSDEKLTLDLLLAPMSPNQVKRHYFNVFRQQRKSHKIRQVLLMKKRRIKVLNSKFDFIACKTLSLLEIDETFKGRKVSLLVVIDTLTGYIFHFHWLKIRSKQGILDALASKRELFYNTLLVLTDGAPYFPEVVKELCPLAKHQQCLIHVMRNLYPHLRPVQGRYKKAQKKLSRLITSLYDKKIVLKEIKYSWKKWKQKEAYWLQKREDAQRRLGVRRYQKNILSLYPELKKINIQINLVQSYQRAIQTSVISHQIKIDHKIQELTHQTEVTNRYWGIYMREQNLLYRFYNLFHLTNKRYEQQRQKLLVSLPHFMNTECQLAKNIMRVLKTIRNLDTVNKANSPVRLTRNFINTNVVESANSKIRPFLDLLRKIGNTEYCRIYFDTIRLKLNTSSPYSGIRVNTSPIERCGYKLRGRTWLDLIFDGLPPGPQSDLFLPKLNWDHACPQRIGKCIIEPEC